MHQAGPMVDFMRKMMKFSKDAIAFATDEPKIWVT